MANGETVYYNRAISVVALIVILDKRKKDEKKQRWIVEEQLFYVQFFKNVMNVK